MCDDVFNGPGAPSLRGSLLEQPGSSCSSERPLRPLQALRSVEWLLRSELEKRRGFDAWFKQWVRLFGDGCGIPWWGGRRLRFRFS